MRFDSYEEQAKKIIFKAFIVLKPVVLAIFLIIALQATGLMSSVSYVGQWAILQTGLKDAGNEADADADDFDYRFAVKDLEGNKTPFEQFKGKVIFLNLWATWCGPCRAEMAGIQKLHDKIDKDKIAFVMLSLDRDSDKGKIVDYFKKRGFTFNAYQPSGYLTPQLNVPSIPTTFIISKEGKIVRKEVGSMKYDTPKFQGFLEDLSAAN
ncbi:MAG: TlpA disulfide reductase family protein [Bacteroidota bacterium]